MVGQHSHSNIMQETAQMRKASSDFIKKTIEISIKVKDFFYFQCNLNKNKKRKRKQVGNIKNNNNHQ